MDCQICTIYAADAPGKYNNCIIECLEKIKLHYMDMLKKIDDNDLTIKNLNERNSKLQKKLYHYERTNKKEILSFSQECDGSEWCSDALENEILNKTVDSLNVALNDEIDFDTSYVSDSPNSYQKQTLLKREPMRPITPANGATGLLDSKKIKDELKECKKEYSFLSKENKSFLGKDNFRKNDRTFLERPKLSLKAGLRQRRLQLSVKKKTSNPSLCLSGTDKGKSSQTTFRRLDDSTDNDRTFELASPYRKNIIPKETPFMQKNDSETSSVMILTPETQDIIFLDDSCNSNIESMDLLRDFVKPSNDRLANLKLFESNRIKLLQKTASTKTMTVHNNNEKGNEERSNNSISEDLEETYVNVPPSPSNEFEETALRSSKEKNSPPKDERLLRLNCDECQKYIKYLGHRLSDEEIEKHIRNCTKHKINDEINPTPDGFWDPKIKPLDKNDPRVKVLTDTRFIRK